jgi:hypothetical protein
VVVTKRNVAAALTAGIGDPNAIAKLAKIAGYSSGSRILIAARGGAPSPWQLLRTPCGSTKSAPER